MTDNYSLVPYTANKFVLFGAYKTYSQAQPGNLFSLPQLTGTKTVLGFIRVKLVDRRLSLEWEESENGSKLLPYLEGCSADIEEGKLYIFGGMDKDGKLTNDLIRYDLCKEEMKTFKVEGRNLELKDVVPCPRRNHGSGIKQRQLFIFGGEVNQTDTVNDFWFLGIGWIDEGDPTNTVKCIKMNKNTMSLRPKPGTPTTWLSYELAYIARSASAVGPSTKNYFCSEQILGRQETTVTHSLERPLPFDRLPHTMEMWRNQVVLGFDSSIYAIPLENKEEKSKDHQDREEPKKSFKDYMRRYFEERPYPDVTFKVQNEEIKAHRGILSARSSFFNELFIKNKEAAVIEISELSPAGFIVLLEWVYCNEILYLEEEVALEIHKVAREYSLPKLKEEVQRLLLERMPMEKFLQKVKRD